jgi:DNA-binding MarR family transcriptional regulator
MPGSELLKELIDRLDDYERALPGGQAGSMEGFAGFLQSALHSGQPQTEAYHDLPQAGDFRDSVDGPRYGDDGPMRNLDGPGEPWLKEQYGSPVHEVPILVSLMYRYARHYVKKAMRDSVLQTMEEFGFLMALVTRESMTKTELIQTAVMEKTSGTEVIRRLLRLGLVREFPDTDDKRSVRVAITDIGRLAAFSLLPNMESVAKIVSGNLSPAEISTLFGLLKKLDNFHNDIYLHRRNASLEELA